MDIFDSAWVLLKSNTLPLKPEIIQYETDPKSWSRYKQTGGIARRAREKMMDESQAERHHDQGETDIMNQNLAGGIDDEMTFEPAYDATYDYTQHLARKSEHLIDDAINFLKATRESRKNSPARKRKQAAGMTDRSQATSNLMSDAERAAVRAQKRRKDKPNKTSMLFDRQNRGVIAREAMRRKKHSEREKRREVAARAKGETYEMKPYVSPDERKGRGVVLPDSDKTFNIREGGRNFTMNEAGMKRSIDAARNKAAKTRNKLAQREYQPPTSGKCENKTCADGNPPLQNAWERKFGICGQCMEDEGMHTSEIDYDRDKLLHMEEYFGGPEATFTGLNQEERKKLGGLFADKGRLNFRNQQEMDDYITSNYPEVSEKEKQGLVAELGRQAQIKEQEGKKLYPSLYDDKKMNTFFDRQELERSTQQEGEQREVLSNRQNLMRQILANQGKGMGSSEKTNLQAIANNPQMYQNINYPFAGQETINRENAQRAAQQQRTNLLQQLGNLTEEQKQALRDQMPGEEGQDGQ